MAPFPISPLLLGPLTFFGLLLLALLGLGRVPIGYNLRNLLVRWPTTLLTALAFVLVVGLLTVMLAFVNGLYQVTTGSGQPGNVVVMSEGATDELFSHLTYQDSGDIERHPHVMHDEQGRALASWELYLVVNQPIPGSEATARKRRFLQVRGLDDPARSGQVHGLHLKPGGRWFSAAGVQALAEEEGEDVIQAVLGEGIARELGQDQGKKSLQVGDLFDIGSRRWIVVGLLRSAGSTFDSEVWAKRQIAGPMFGKESTYTTLVLRTADAATAKATAADLTANYKKSAVQAQVETEYYEKLNETNEQFLFTILVVAIFMAAGGVFAVMNTMFAAISQRIKDIGILRILGYSRRQVLVSFFLESLLLAVLGGILGCSAGALCNGWMASSIVGSSPGGGKSVVLELVVDGNIVAAGLLFSLLMGSLGGLVPALWAVRLRALESLRVEVPRVQLVDSRLVVLRRVQVAQGLKGRVHVRQFGSFHNACRYCLEQEEGTEPVLGQEPCHGLGRLQSIDGGQGMMMAVDVRDADGVLFEEVDQAAHESRP